MKNIVFYLLLICFIIFYLLFSLLGFLPLVAYSYGLLLTSILKYLINIDRIFINIFTFFILKQSSPDLINHVLTTNFRKNKILLHILSSVISIFILYIIFRTFTTLLFYIINNFILNRPACRSIQISSRASHPILMTYMFVFLILGLGKYLKDFGQNITTSFLSKDSMFFTLINGIGSSIDGFINVMLKVFVLSIPIIGKIINMIFGYLQTFLLICGNIEKILESGTKNNTRGEYSNLIDFFKKAKVDKQKLQKNASYAMGLPFYESNFQNEKQNLKIDEFADSVLMYLDNNKTNNVKSFVFGGLVVLTYKLFEIIQKLSKYIGGTANILSVVQRGFLAGAMSFVVLIIILIMVIFFPNAFGS
jgi:hypothetical protein